MKTLIVLASLLIASSSFAGTSKNGVERGAVLSMKGQILTCGDPRDLGNTAYKLLLPSLKTEGEELNFGLYLSTMKCEKDSGRIKWVNKDMPAPDKIIVKDFSKHIFKIKGYILNPEKLANGIYSLKTKFTTNGLLKKKELKKLNAGKTIVKKLAVFYGNHNYWSDGVDFTTYKDSLGRYKLEIKLKKNKETKQLESTILKFAK